MMHTPPLTVLKEDSNADNVEWSSLINNTTNSSLAKASKKQWSKEDDRKKAKEIATYLVRTYNNGELNSADIVGEVRFCLGRFFDTSEKWNGKIKRITAQVFGILQSAGVSTSGCPPEPDFRI